MNTYSTPRSRGGPSGLNKKSQAFSAKIAGKGLREDARLRALAAAGGLRPGIHVGYSRGNATARGLLTDLLAGTQHGARKARPRIWERGRPARKKTNAGKMPALQRGSGINAVRESGSAGVPPAIHQRTEKPRQRGLRFSAWSKPLPGVKRRASRPPPAEKARQRAFASGDTMRAPKAEKSFDDQRRRVAPPRSTPVSRQRWQNGGQGNKGAAALCDQSNGPHHTKSTPNATAMARQ